MEASDAFQRIHFAKVKLNKIERKYEIVDNFNKVSFTATIPEGDTRYIKVVDLEESTLFSVVKSTDDEFTIKSTWGQDVGYIIVQSGGKANGPISTEILNNERETRFKVTKVPLIQKTNEFHVTSVETREGVGRINVVRSKAVMSMQPELEAIHRVRIIATSIVLLGIYNDCW